MKLLLFLLSFFFFFSSCSEKKKSEVPVAKVDSGNTVKLTDDQIKNAGIVTERMQQKRISSVLKVNGKIDVPPQNMVSISVPLGGYLKTTRLLPGMHVNKSAIIAVIEDPQYIQLQQEYLTAKTRINFLAQEYQRQKELNNSKASSDKVYQQAEADFKSEQILVTALAQKLQLAGINIDALNENNISRSVNIYSPIDGYVSKVNVNIGKYVSPTEVLFELINPTDIHLALKVYEKDLDKLYIGQPLTAYTNNQPDNKHPCEILLIGKDLTAERSTDVHCHFEQYDKLLVPGTYMNADIEVKNSIAFALPEDAVVRFENRQYVFVKKAANRFTMTEVNTSDTEDGFTEIIANDKIRQEEFVVRGAYSLLMSLKNKSED